MRFKDVLDTTSSSVILLVSPFIMRRRMPGTTYYPVPSGVCMGHCRDPDAEVPAAEVDRSVSGSSLGGLLGLLLAPTQFSCTRQKLSVKIAFPLAVLK
jgi:hypothetical protein